MARKRDLTTCKKSYNERNCCTSIRTGRCPGLGNGKTCHSKANKGLDYGIPIPDVSTYRHPKSLRTHKGGRGNWNKKVRGSRTRQ